MYLCRLRDCGVEFCVYGSLRFMLYGMGWKGGWIMDWVVLGVYLGASISILLLDFRFDSR